MSNFQRLQQEEWDRFNERRAGASAPMGDLGTFLSFFGRETSAVLSHAAKKIGAENAAQALTNLSKDPNASTTLGALLIGAGGGLAAGDALKDSTPDAEVKLSGIDQYSLDQLATSPAPPVQPLTELDDVKRQHIRRTVRDTIAQLGLGVGVGVGLGLGRWGMDRALHSEFLKGLTTAQGFQRYAPTVAAGAAGALGGMYAQSRFDAVQQMKQQRDLRLQRDLESLRRANGEPEQLVTNG